MSKYPYFLLPAGGQGKPVCKPYVQIRLGCKKTHRVLDKYLLTALIDSGSDVCLCKKYIGDYLGVNFKNLKTHEIRGVNKSCMNCIICPLTIYFQGKSYETSFYLTDELPDETPVILGQKGFFDHFKISFDLSNKEIEII